MLFWDAGFGFLLACLWLYTAYKRILRFVPAANVVRDGLSWWPEEGRAWFGHFEILVLLLLIEFMDEVTILLLKILFFLQILSHFRSSSLNLLRVLHGEMLEVLVWASEVVWCRNSPVCMPLIFWEFKMIPTLSSTTFVDLGADKVHKIPWTFSLLRHQFLTNS